MTLRPSRRRPPLRTACVLGVGAVLLAGCGTGESSVESTSTSAQVQGPQPAAAPNWTITRTAVAGLRSHVHTLMARRDGTLLAGAHDGLYSVPATGKATRSSDQAFDVMGLARAEGTTLVASGHPAPEGPGPNPLGLVSSDDGGRTWRTVSLAGEADLHLIAAHDRRIVAHDGRQLISSSDGGSTWRAVPATATPPPPEGTGIESLSVDARNVWLTAGGKLYRSSDGTTFTADPAAPRLRATSIAPDGSLWGLAEDGMLWVRSRSGAWQHTATLGPVDGFAGRDYDTAHVLTAGNLITVARGLRAP